MSMVTKTNIYTIVQFLCIYCIFKYFVIVIHYTIFMSCMLYYLNGSRATDTDRIATADYFLV